MILGITTEDFFGLEKAEIPDFGVMTPVAITHGQLSPQGPIHQSHPLFFSGIEWLGPCEPISNLPAQKIFSDMVFFNGRNSDIISSFERFKTSRSLSGLLGCYMDPGTFLILDGKHCLVNGTGGIILFRPLTGKNHGLESDLVRYAPGNSFLLDIEEPQLTQLHPKKNGAT
jgi:hypothetical protein